MHSNSVTLIFSPHADDVVFSMFSYLKEIRNPKVITVCGGIPKKSYEISNWDKKCGFISAYEAGIARREEDAIIFCEMGIELKQLNFLDLPYAQVKEDIDIENAILDDLLTCGEVYIPMGVGSHKDHLITRNSVLNIIKKEKLNVEVKIYEDAPYSNCKINNIPEEKKFGFSVDKAFKEIQSLGFNLSKIEKRILSHQEMLEKLKYVSLYHSQIIPLKTYYPNIDKNFGELSIETLWRGNVH